MKKLTFFNIMFGCDPEFFFRRGSDVVGAEKILPLSGLEYTPGEFGRKDGGYGAMAGTVSKIIIDGVQAELNPRPNGCRAQMGNELACIFTKLKDHMKQYDRLRVDFKQTIKLTKKDFSALSDNSKKFGCMPSKNSHDNGKEGKITVNPETYKYRSAGGHLHFGAPRADYFNNDKEVITRVLAQPERLIRMMDILVGNTCVLLDRDPGNVERRKVYGRAGEFRTPPHGVEYRTLSNFWLRSYQLMSLVMGLARHAVIIVANDMDGEFVKLVNMEEIADAINTNSFTKALRNFKRIEQLLLEITPQDDQYSIHAGTIKQFKHFVKMGIDYWFKDEPVEHWIKLLDGHETGIETFLRTVVSDDMAKK